MRLQRSPSLSRGPEPAVAEPFEASRGLRCSGLATLRVTFPSVSANKANGRANAQSLTLRDFDAAREGLATLRVTFPSGSANRANGRADAQSLTLRDFDAARRHPSPPAAGRCKAQKNQRSSKLDADFLCFAESEGFEPPNPLRSTVFKTAAINHSANSPSRLGLQI